MTWVRQRGLSHVVAMIVGHHKVVIARRVIVGRAKGHQVAIGHISPGRIKASVRAHRVATGRISHGRAKVVSAKVNRVVTGRTSRGRTRVSVKGHQVAIDRTGHKVTEGHAHRAINNSSMARRVARVSGHLRRRASRVPVMISTRCHRHHRQVQRLWIKTRCVVGVAGWRSDGAAPP